VDGVSLTASALERDGFGLFLIPETVARTTLGALRVGDEVNLEADYLAKLVRNVVERMPAVAGRAASARRRASEKGRGA
jgi:riboflavin synthase